MPGNCRGHLRKVRYDATVDTLVKQRQAIAAEQKSNRYQLQEVRMAMPSASGESRRALNIASKSLQERHIELLAEKAATNRQISNLTAQSPTRADRDYAGGFNKTRRGVYPHHQGP